MAFLVVLETMTPAERVAFVLHDVFRYPSPRWPRSSAGPRPPAASWPPRPAAESARRGLPPPRPRSAQPPSATPAIVRDFKAAWEAKDIGALIGLLDPGATAVADGGGLVSAALRPIEGGGQVARYLAGIAGRLPRLTITTRTVNGQPGLVAELDGAVVTVFAFDIAADKITRIWIIRNPSKLTRWASQAV